jgi:hypothetical protein
MLLVSIVFSYLVDLFLEEKNLFGNKLVIYTIDRTVLSKFFLETIQDLYVLNLICFEINNFLDILCKKKFNIELRFLTFL